MGALRSRALEPCSLVKTKVGMRSMRETVDSAGSGNQLLPNPGSIRALINMETGESGPLKAVKTFVPLLEHYFYVDTGLTQACCTLTYPV